MFCEHARKQSPTIVQRAFVIEFAKNAPTTIQTRTRYKMLKEEGCLRRARVSARSPVSKEMVERVRVIFL